MEWKEGHPCGERSISDTNGNVTHSGVWKNGYLKERYVVIEFERESSDTVVRVIVIK